MPQTSVDGGRHRGGLFTAALFLVFLALAVVATQPLALESSTRLPANADALLNSWTLKMACRGLAHPSSALRGNMFFPDGASLLYSEPLIGLAIQSAPMCALGVSHVTLFNVTYVVTLALCALGAWLLAREITGSAPAALIAAIVFAFTSANYDSAARIQIVASQWTPFCLLFLIRFCRRGLWKDSVLLGLSFAMQALSCTYYELFLALLLVLAVPFWIQLAGGITGARRRIAGAALAALIASGLVVPLNAAQRLHLDPVLAARPQAQVITLDFFNDVLPTNLLYGGALGRARVAYDAMYFPGIVPLMLAVLAVFFMMARRERVGWSTGLMPVAFIGIAAFLFAFGTMVSTPWGEAPGPLSLFAALPGLGQARVPSRFLMFSRLALAVLAAVGATRVLGSSSRTQWVRAGVLSVACFVEHWSTPLDTWIVPTRAQLPRVYDWLENDGRALGPILEFPPAPMRLRRDEATWLHVGAFHGVPMANGYSSFRPAWFEFVMEAALQSPDQRLTAILRQIGVRTIIVHTRPRGVPEMDRATAALIDYATAHPEELRLRESFSDPSQLAGLWSRLGDEKVFSIEPSNTSTPAVTRTPPIDRSGWSCRSSAPDCERALDGDPKTSLRGEDAQSAGEFLRVIFTKPTPIHAVSVNMGRDAESFPRDVFIRLQRGDTWERPDATLDVTGFLADMLRASVNPTITWSFPEATVTGFEIRLRSGGPGFRPLTLPEVNAHGPR